MLQLSRKIAFIYAANFVLLILLFLIYSSVFDKSYLEAILSSCYGFFIFVSIYSVNLYLFKRNQSNRLLTSGIVLYEVIYAFLIKLCILALLLALSFKLFDLNNKIILITFSYMVILRIIIYLRIGIKGCS